MAHEVDPGMRSTSRQSDLAAGADLLGAWAISAGNKSWLSGWMLPTSMFFCDGGAPEQMCASACHGLPGFDGLETEAIHIRRGVPGFCNGAFEDDACGVMPLPIRYSSQHRQEEQPPPERLDPLASFESFGTETLFEDGDLKFQEPHVVAHVRTRPGSPRVPCPAAAPSGPAWTPRPAGAGDAHGSAGMFPAPPAALAASFYSRHSVASSFCSNRLPAQAAPLAMLAAADHEPPEFVTDGLHPKAAAVHPKVELAASMAGPGGAAAEAPSGAALAAQDPHVLATPKHPAAEPAYVRGLKLGGFYRAGLNEVYIERPMELVSFGGRETYWGTTGRYFMYFSEQTRTWVIEKVSRLESARNGSSYGVVHSPEAFDPVSSECVAVQDAASPDDGGTGDMRSLDEAAQRKCKYWWEWDGSAGKWVPNFKAGIESRGKARLVPMPEAKK